MGFMDRVRGVAEVATFDAGPGTVPDPRPRHTFAIGDDLATWNALIAGAGPTRISRDEAQSVPAVKRARDLIAGTLGTLPLQARNGNGDRVDHPLLAQPEAPLGLVRTVTMARTVEDLLFEANALWLVLTRTAQGFPASVQRIESGHWQQDPQTRVIRVEGREVDPRDVILFNSPNDPLLKVGARAIRSLLLLEKTAEIYCQEPEPSVSWRAADGVDPDEDDVREFLAAWVAARKARGTAFVPAAYERMTAERMTADELQLIDARSFAVLEISRLTGIDGDWLSVNTTSRTYLNGQDARRSFVDFVLAPFIAAVEQRLSLNDVTPNGQQVRYNLDAFLRADTAERYSSYAVALSNGFLTLDEVRQLENRPPLPAGGDLA